MKKLTSLIIITLFFTQAYTQTDEDILNQIFPSLIKNLGINQFKPFHEFESAKQILYYSENKLLVIDSIYFLKPNSIKSYLAVHDKRYIGAIGLQTSSFNIIPKEYINIHTDSSNLLIKPRKIDISKINNTGLINLKYSSEFSFDLRGNLWQFWSEQKKQNNYYFAGFFSPSMIYFNSEKTHAIFYCIYSNHPEMSVYLNCLKKEDNNWVLEHSIWLGP